MMGTTLTVGELLIEITNRHSDNRPFSFIDYQPRNIPGWESDIAQVYGCSSNQTENLLTAVDEIEEEHSHFLVESVVLREATRGSKGEPIPAQIRKTIIPA